MSAAVETPWLLSIDGDAYHADPCPEPSLSSTVAKILCAQTPLHAWTAHPRLNPDHKPKEAAHFDIGTAAHMVLLGGEETVEVVDAADWRTNAAKDQRDQARKDGKTPLLAKDWSEVRLMVEAARTQLDATEDSPPLFKDGLAEQTLTWQEPNGVWCRSRLDWLRHDRATIDDYKTTTDANPNWWARKQFFNLGYDVQAAFYSRGVWLATGHRPRFRFVVQEKTSPYLLSVLVPSAAAIEVADAKIASAVRVFGECLASGVWPGYGFQVTEIAPPVWEFERWTL